MGMGEFLKVEATFKSRARHRAKKGTRFFSRERCARPLKGYRTRSGREGVPAARAVRGPFADPIGGLVHVLPRLLERDAEREDVFHVVDRQLTGHMIAP